MTLAKWGTYRNFNEQEAWGDSSRMSHELLLALDDFRDYVRTPVLVLCGTQKEHTRHSKHPKGEAVDVTFLERGETPLFELFLSAFRFPFTGVGVYPHWTHNGKTVGGLHVELTLGETPRKMWLGVRPNKDEPQVYLPVSRKNLRLYGVV